MIFLTILICILAMSLPFFKTQITPVFFTRIAALAFIYAGVLTFNTLHIHSIGSGIGIFCGFFQVTYFSLFIETFIYVVGAIILLSWPLVLLSGRGVSGRQVGLGDVAHDDYSLDSNSVKHLESYNESNKMPLFFKGLRHIPFSGLSEFRADSNNRTGYNKVSGAASTIGSVLLKTEKTLNNYKISGGSGSLQPLRDCQGDCLWVKPISKHYSSEVNYNSGNSLENETRGVSVVSKEYSLIALFSTLGGSLLLSSGDLLSMYLSIELQSFGLYILATLYRDSESATGAGLKYFLLGGLSSCLILLGASLVYSFTGLTNLESIYNLVSVISINNLSNLELGLTGTSLMELRDEVINHTEAGGLMAYQPLFFNGAESDSLLISPVQSKASGSQTDYLLTNAAAGAAGVNVIQGLSLGLILIIVGFLFKISAAPFHNWSPDVYDDSPTNVTIWLTIMPKIAIVIFLLELEMGIVSAANPTIYTAPILLQLEEALPSAAVAVNASLDSLNLAIEANNSTLALNTQAGIGDSSNSAYLPAGGVGYVLKNLFLLSSLLSLILGTVVGLAQIRIKRLLAYSSISHVGFLLLALAINSEESTESLILYLIQYTITSLNTFFILLAFGYIINSSAFSSAPSIRNTNTTAKTFAVSVADQLKSGLTGTGNSNSPQFTNPEQNPSGDFDLQGGTQIKTRDNNSDIRFIIDLKGQFFYNPILSLSLAICLFSMAGIPPLMGFFGKLSVLYAAIGNGYFFMALVAIIVSVISAYYYLRIIRELHAEPINNKVRNEKSGDVQKGLGLLIENLPIKELPSLQPLRKAKSPILPSLGNDIVRGGNGYSFPAPLYLSQPLQKQPKVNRPESHFGGRGWNKGCGNLVLTNIHSFIIATLTLSILFFVLKPSILLNSTVLLSLSLFNG